MLRKILHLSPIYSYQISGQSMCPTFKPGDTVLVNRLSYLTKLPIIGDIVAIKDPRDDKTLIKRIAKIENDKFFVAGDNKNESTDSRNFGLISKRNIIGKVVYTKK